MIDDPGARRIPQTGFTDPGYNTIYSASAPRGPSTDNLHRSRAEFFRLNSCSQIRITFQPLARSSRFTSLSRALLRAIFVRQNEALVLGLVPCLGHPCQKQPSTNSVTFSFEKTKSGLPGSFDLRRQPVMPFTRKT